MYMLPGLMQLGVLQGHHRSVTDTGYMKERDQNLYSSIKIYAYIGKTKIKLHILQYLFLLLPPVSEKRERSKTFDMTLYIKFGTKTTGTDVAKASVNEALPDLLILASGTPSSIEAAAADIRTSHPDAKIATVSVDLLSQASIREADSKVAVLTPRVDIIINNATMVSSHRKRCPEGIEGQFAANHLGNFLLTKPLSEKFPAAVQGKARIVNVTSESHRTSPVRFSDYKFEKRDEELPVEEQSPYLSNCQFGQVAEWAMDKEAAEKLRKLSKKLVGQAFA
ncbi:hypothetical protein BS50DRAFT_590900 [Corynespora cassiicola Philippines]|uniref:NAD(P)-binding protein n=1 Tax=Corynespora cassiicola Philippines TaxID=1448308 RepID=A0A2T2NEP1_CORCC|nr:hypothetical protein BS50DRAFT_590900 [Corynespora cassiicola Philippines]